MHNDFGVFVVVLSPFMFGGDLQAKGDKLEVPAGVARNLLGRGKVKLDPAALVPEEQDDATEDAPAEPAAPPAAAPAPKAPRQRKSAQAAA